MAVNMLSIILPGIADWLRIKFAKFTADTARNQNSSFARGHLGKDIHCRIGEGIVLRSENSFNYEETHRKRAKHTVSRQREMTRSWRGGDEVNKGDQKYDTVERVRVLAHKLHCICDGRGGIARDDMPPYEYKFSFKPYLPWASILHLCSSMSRTMNAYLFQDPPPRL